MLVRPQNATESGRGRLYSIEELNVYSFVLGLGANDREVKLACDGMSDSMA
jgi:hypothetical protein